MNDTILVANKYRIIEQLGRGAFGSVYKGIYVQKGISVALKFEDATTSFKMLKHETTLLKYLHDHGCRGIPIIYWYGSYQHSICLVMGYYECSLYDYIKRKDLSVNKLNNIMVQYINILQSVHTHFVIHRDIKPQNCMIKSGNMFLIDFGLATFYTNDENMHITDSEITETIVGTPKYISFNVHDACIPTCRDDLISLGYIYIYLCAKELPWDGVSAIPANDEYSSELYIMNSKNQQRKALKTWSSIQPICLRICKQLEQFMGYCYQLTCAHQPNYELCISFFTHL